MHTASLALLTGIVLLPFAAQDPARPLPPAPAAPAQAKTDATGLQSLEWLCGTWVSEDGPTTTEEHWRPLQGSTLLGSSHTFAGGTTRFFEHLRIAPVRGTLAYVAMPGGAAATVFPVSKLEPRAVVFENGKHDHPQRIRYEQTDTGMTATISQLDGSRAQRFVFVKKL
jgi:hypothetical protein